MKKQIGVTYNPHSDRTQKKQGFRARMAKGGKVIKSRRAKGRKNVSI